MSSFWSRKKGVDLVVDLCILCDYWIGQVFVGVALKDNNLLSECYY